MRGLYLIILRSIKEMNLDEKKLNSKSTDRSQQTTGKLAYRDLYSPRNDPDPEMIPNPEMIPKSTPK